MNTKSQPVSKVPRLMIVMGVSGCGKSTIAEGLAEALRATCLDADDYHPANNIAKMSRGDALNDEDRWPWLKHFAQTMAAQDGRCVGACSSLKRSYRIRLTESSGEPILFIYLDGDKALLVSRMSARTDHFMPPALLDSQLSALERPDVDECSISVDINATPSHIISQIQTQIEELNND